MYLQLSGQQQGPCLRAFWLRVSPHEGALLQRSVRLHIVFLQRLQQRAAKQNAALPAQPLPTLTSAKSLDRAAALFSWCKAGISLKFNSE